jgi:predicted RNA-binding protein YlqC (UPF0109 family)
MAQYVETPDGLVEFPDEMSVDEIQAVLTEYYGTPEVPQTTDQVSQPAAAAQISDATQRPGGPMGMVSDIQRPVKQKQTNVQMESAVSPTFLETAEASAVDLLPELGATGFGIVGTAVGGPILGIPMAGLGGMFGDVLQNLIQGESTKVDEMVKEGLLQAAFEAGGGVIAKVGGQGLRIAPEALRLAGITTDNATQALQQMLKSRPDLVQAGSLESLQATQKLLTEGGGTLSKTQSGQAGPLATFGEKLARIGITGEGSFVKIQEKNDKIIIDAFDDLVQGTLGRTRDPSEIGVIFTEAIDSGRSALSAQYGKRLDEISQQFGGSPVSTQTLKNAVDDKIAKGTVDFDSIDPAVRKFYEMVKELPDNMQANRAIDLIKFANQRLNEMLNPAGQGYNTVAAAELTSFIDEILKPQLRNGLAKVNPKAFKEYDDLNKFYSQSKEALSPKLLEAVARKGEAKDFAAVGQTLFGTTKLETVDAAFRALQKAKRLNPDLNILEAGDALRQGYLTKFFGSEGRSINQLRTMAKRIEENTNQKELFNRVLGVSAPRTKKLLNAALDSAGTPGEGVLTLSFRGRELGALTDILGGGAILTGDVIGIAGGLTLLSTPAVLAKISLNPKAVNKLININKASRSMTPQVLSTALIRFGNEFGIPIEEEGKRLIEGMQVSDLLDAAKIEQLPQ